MNGDWHSESSTVDSGSLLRVVGKSFELRGVPLPHAASCATPHSGSELPHSTARLAMRLAEEVSP